MTQLCFNLYQKYGPWIITNKGDQDCRELADRHYTHQKIGSRQFTRPGRNLVLKTVDAKAVWVTWSGVRDDGLQAYECTIFRNDGSGQLSSELIKWAIFATVCEWGDEIPRDCFITYFDGQKVNSKIPGYCFKRAGGSAGLLHHLVQLNCRFFRGCTIRQKNASILETASTSKTHLDHLHL